MIRIKWNSYISAAYICDSMELAGSTDWLSRQGWVKRFYDGEFDYETEEIVISEENAVAFKLRFGK